MRNSSEQANLFKDKYIKNILGNSEVSQNVELPERDLGEVASIVEDIGTGTITAINDNSPFSYIVDTDKNEMWRIADRMAANPIKHFRKLQETLGLIHGPEPWRGLGMGYFPKPHGTVEQYPMTVSKRNIERERKEHYDRSHKIFI